MDSTSGTNLARTKESTNYARLCRLLVDVGSRVLRATFDKIHPPARLHDILSSHPVRARLESLYKEKCKIPKSTQWRKLYPPYPSSVSSQEFDITLLMVLLRNISGLNPPATGWNNPPAATDTSTEADITRLRNYRNEVFAHASQASVDDPTFGKYWQDIRQTLIRLGGQRYGRDIDKVKVDCMDPDIKEHYQELLKKWAKDEDVIEEIEGNSGCLYAQAIDISLLEPSVDFRSTSNFLNAKAGLWSLIRSLQFWRKHKPGVSSRAAACRMNVIAMNEEVDCTKHRLNRISPEMCHTDEERKVTNKVMTLLEEAINFHQSDLIAEARKKLWHVSDFKTHFFTNPTKHGLRVLSRGKELFLEDGVSCSVKHGILLLDSSNFGAQFYISFLNVIGAFAVAISEMKLANEIYSLLFDLHDESDVTSRRRDLGAAYNNRGCVSLILGDLKQAERDFEKSLKHLDSEKRHQPQSSLLETILIAVNCNIARLRLLSRRFPEALEKQEKLVKRCKECKELQELPLQVVFTVLNNQAVLCTTLGNFNKAEEALKWLIFYCYDMTSEECEFLLNFVSLHLSEVLLLHGKSKEAEKAFGLETLKSADDIELVQMFGGLHINVRIEALEKLVDVIFLTGKIRFACELLETGVNILKKSFGPDHFNVASLLYKQGKILSSIGEASSAAEKFKCSLDILKEMFGVSHPLLLKCYMSLGDQTLRLQRTDDSYLYFQRAMENIEEIYQVSFVSELSRKYMEITVEPFQECTVRDDTRRIEGLVAEHGLAFAVLLSRPVVQDNNSPLRRRKGTQPITTSDSMEIISLKCTRDFLQSGQTLLRQGMKKEAAAFFRQAAEYCTAYHVVKGPPNPCLARLYSILTKKQLGSQEALDDNRDLINCLEELGEVTTKVITDSRSKRSTEDIATVTSDCQLNLKLVLIFLILLSIQMKMIDTSFAAYDLYAKLSQNDESLLLFLNGGVQVYASRTSITCNGNTAVQDVFVSSTAGLHEDDSESPISENQLFRSLACKKSVPTDRYLVTYSSSILLDIDDLQDLERKISPSVQECFQLKCFESEIEGSATQVLVDLSSMAICDFYDIASIGRRIKLLPLCLTEEINAEVSHEGNISEISTAMYQKITRLTFEDEQTSSFMFSKNILSLLQCNSGKISSLSVQSQCLSITIIHPVKARLTLWRIGKCIKQKIQFVQSASHGQTGWTVPQQTPCKELVEDCNAADRFSWPEVEYWAKTYHARFLTDDVDSDELLDVSNKRCERHGIIFDGRNDRRVQISSEETEQNELLRICLNDSVLKGLTFISDISRELSGDETQEGNDVIEVVPDRTEASCSTSFSQGQLQQEIISSSSQQATINPDVEIASHNLTLEAPNSAAVEEEPWTPEGNPMEREEDYNELGRSIFEEKRKSRRSFMAELPKSLKNKKGTSESNVVNSKIALEEVIQNGGDLVIDLPRAGTRYIAKSAQSKTRNDITSSEQPPFNTEAELQTPNLYEPWIHDEKPREADEQNALERYFFEEDKNSRSDSIERLKDPNTEKTTNKSNCLGIENSPVCEKPSGKQETAEGPCYDPTRKVESSPLPGASDQMAQEDEKQSIIKPTADNVFSKVEVEDATLLNLCQPEKPASTHDQTQNQQEVHRPRTHTATYVEMDRPSPQIGAMKDYTVQERYGAEVTESNKVQNEPLENKVIAKPVSYGNMTTTRTPRSSFEVDDDIAPDGPASGTSRRIQSNANESTSLTNTNSVGRPIEKVGKNLQIQSGLLPSKEIAIGALGKSNVNDYYDEALQNGTQRTTKSQFVHKNAKETAFRYPFLGFLGGDVLVDGDSSNATFEEDVVDGPISTNFPKEGEVGIYGGEALKKSLDTSKEISGNEITSFPLDTARDVVDGPAYSPNMPLGFGGARPKERSKNTIRKTSAITTKITEPIQAYQCDETEALGIYPRFLERHTVKSNGAILEAPSQDGYNEPYFSAKALVHGENLRASGERINPSGYASNGSGLGLCAEQACAARTSTRGNVKLLARHQKPPLYQEKSWHFPPPVADETTAMQNNCYIDQGCVGRRHSTHLEDSIKALFSSRESQSAYNEMDSMTNEYHNSIGDNGAVRSATVSAGQQSATEDSTSSLLGSLQQIMAKTVKLIAVSDTVGKQPQQEPKEIEKVGIQEEARGSRDQEQAVTTVVEDSRNQEESSQENEPTLDTERQSIPTPVQESPRPVCSHYQRRCLVRFPCCGKFYPCHRCHNESEDCSDDQARAINATHIRCTICYHEQVIDEQSQTCGGCKSKMSEYFCPTCKHFTSVDKNPFHCDKCGICRIHRDRSFHCDVCNVCLDKRLEGKHKCRPDSGHDECCICLEDAFSGCQILPCSHKVHKDCAIAMIQNGVRTCPICRHPLFSQPQNSTQ